LFGESFIDAKKAPNEWEGNPFGKWIIDVFFLVNTVFIDTLAKVYLM
jgi:hypothetical protein